MKKVCTFFLFFLLHQLIFAQENSSIANTEARADFIQQFTGLKYIEWPKGTRKNFDVFILRDSLLYEKVKQKIERKSFSGKKIRVFYAKQITEINSNPEFIYANSRDGFSMPSLLNQYKGKPVLILGENYPFHSSMINLVSINGTVVYEINESLINAQGLKALNPLLKNQATSEIEWKKSLDKSNQELESEKKLLEKTKKQLAQTEKEKAETESQLAETNSLLETTSDTLQTAKGAVAMQNKIISVQDHDLQMKELEITAQRKINITIGIILFMALALSFFIFRSFKISRRANIELASLNKSLKKHKDEIFLQKIEIEERGREIQESIQYAKHIQSALMPSAEILQNYFSDSFLFYRPKDVVSGDFFWFAETPDSWIIAVVDCTGHGVPGAMMSVVGIKLLNQAVNENKMYEPNEILHFLDKGIVDSFSINNNYLVRDGMDIAICKINKKTPTVEYSGVYNPLYIVNANGLKELKPDKKAIGYPLQDFRYNKQIIPLEKGDCIYLFSDGFADQFGGEFGKKFKYAQFKSMLTRAYKSPMKDQCRLIASEFDKWRGKLEQIDDVCIMGVRL